MRLTFLLCFFTSFLFAQKDTPLYDYSSWKELQVPIDLKIKSIHFDEDKVIKSHQKIIHFKLSKVNAVRLSLNVKPKKAERRVTEDKIFRVKGFDWFSTYIRLNLENGDYIRVSCSETPIQTIGTLRKIFSGIKINPKIEDY